MIAHNYKLGLPEVLFATTNHTLINNFSAYNIPLDIDDNFINTCVNNKFFPFEEYKLTPTTNHLLAFCSVSNTTDIIKRIISYDSGIKPTIECLHAACKITNNTSTIKLLTTFVTPDLMAIQLYATASSNPGLIHMLTLYSNSTTATATATPTNFDFVDF